MVYFTKSKGFSGLKSSNTVKCDLVQSEDMFIFVYSIIQYYTFFQYNSGKGCTTWQDERRFTDHSSSKIGNADVTQSSWEGQVLIP